MNRFYFFVGVIFVLIDTWVMEEQKLISVLKISEIPGLARRRCFGVVLLECWKMVEIWILRGHLTIT